MCMCVRMHVCMYVHVCLDACTMKLVRKVRTAFFPAFAARFSSVAFGPRPQLLWAISGVAVAWWAISRVLPV